MTQMSRLPGRALVATGIVALLILGAAAPASAGGSSHDRESRADRKLDRALQRFVASDGGPPAAIAVVQRRHGATLHAAGTAELGTKRRPRIDDHLRLASVAKAFSGATVLSVVADGKLSLDDTIGEVLPDLEPKWNAVTLRQLLQHTSGIPDFSGTQAFRDALVASLDVAPPPVQLLSYVAGQDTKFTPGTQYEYSNSDNIIIGLMVEAATGVSYERALAGRVSRPLGLRRTSLPSGIELPTPFVHGYQFPPDEPVADVSEAFAAGWAWASGGVVSTPGDANRFIRGYAAGRTTNRRTWAQQLKVFPGGEESSEPTGPGRNDAGLGIFRYQTRCGTVYGHTGNTAGFTAFVAARADGKRSVSVVVSRQITHKDNPDTYPALRNIFELGVCAAMA